MSKKVCKRCGRNRKIGKFGKLSRSKDGKNYYCRDCMQILTNRYKNSIVGKTKQKKAVKKWKVSNKDHIKEYNGEYYISNKKRILYNKKCREETESILISENTKKIKQKKINKGNKEYNIVINPKRRIDG